MFFSKIYLFILYFFFNFVPSFYKVIGYWLQVKRKPHNRTTSKPYNCKT